ncbi:glutamate mutase [Marmoricola sp. Leaf446]|uniref:glutamate mutase L n=1 Tax=Marmoricola sp. Leaf446 TaxID=1736379 RepID=UPI0006FED61E|nr:glutamate mutase L [Marmoricola sp. Leaf446]KQT91543.1 glutamate mutase [Marmoricola sp. Leaf446]
MEPLLCVDLGSTFTKAALVDGDTGDLLGTASHPTTLATDVMDGVDACRAALAARHPGAADAALLACSSAGGGLRIAVVGTEELVTAEAGRRVALSSGGKVAAVLSGGLGERGVAALRGARPDVVLLVGGTDGGNSEVLLADAASLAAAGWDGPVVVAGDVEAREEVGARLAAGGAAYLLSDNVLPRIGVLTPGPARRAVREVFLSHVIGGKGLSTRVDLASLVRGPTPDLVLTGVEVLAAVTGQDVVVVDVGGATTDVHSVVQLDPEEATLSREVVASSPVTRTVEGDLGMRWSAASTWDAATAAGLDPGFPRDQGVRRAERPDLLPEGPDDAAVDLTLAGSAATLACRRHAGRARVVTGPDGRVVERSGTDLRRVGLLVGSGGVLRHAPPARAEAVLARLVGTSPEGWQLPASPRVVVDRHYVLAAVGLLAESHADAAGALARSLTTWESHEG